MFSHILAQCIKWRHASVRHLHCSSTGCSEEVNVQWPIGKLKWIKKHIIKLRDGYWKEINTCLVELRVHDFFIQSRQLKKHASDVEAAAACSAIKAYGVGWVVGLSLNTVAKCKLVDNEGCNSMHQKLTKMLNEKDQQFSGVWAKEEADDFEWKSK